MPSVNKLILFFILSLISSVTFSQQKNSEKLRQQQLQLERNIQQTKLLLSKTSSNKTATLNDLSLLENQIKDRENLLSNYDQQIRTVELRMKQNSTLIDQLEDKIVQLKEQYKKLLIYVYKNKIYDNKLMYIFSAHTYYEAFKRNEYLRKIAQIQNQQRELIYQHEEKLSNEIKSLAADKKRKVSLLNEKRTEKEEFEQDKVKVQEIVQKLSSEENSLTQKIHEDERKRAQLQNRIDAEIRKEILAAEAAKRKKEAEEAKRRKKQQALAAAKAKKDNPITTTNPVESKPESKDKPETPEFTSSVDLTLNKNFESNRGRLPLPVASGAVTSSFGRHTHELLKDVVTNNNGIDITTSKNAQVRAVFDGEVSSIFSMPGIGKIVIIKHGNYRTVYSNLQEVFVNIGTKVSTKQAIGSLIPIAGENVSILHFEIHQVNGSNVLKQNPSLWLAN